MSTFPPLDSLNDEELLRAAKKHADRMGRTGAQYDQQRSQRDLFVAELHRRGVGYDRIAKALGMTKARVQQIVKAAE